MREISFFQRFESDIIAGRKTITIRDEYEADFKAGEILRAVRHEDAAFFALIKVLSVKPIFCHALTEQHAQQENMTLDELQKIIQEIYPGKNELFAITFTKD